MSEELENTAVEAEATGVPAEESVPAAEETLSENVVIDEHGIRHNKEESAEATMDPLKRKNFSWRNFGGEGLIFSVIFHAVLGIIAIFLVVHHYVQQPEEDPDAFVSGAGGGSNGDRPERHMKPKNRPDMKQAKAKITSKSATSTIALPEMPQMSMGSSFSGGMDAGESSGMGGGFGGGIGTGVGVGVGNGKNFVSAFGSRLKRDQDMEGFIYDLKRRKDGSEICTTAPGDQGKRKKELHDALVLLHNDGKASSAWDMKKLGDRWYKAPTALYNSRIFVVGDNGRALQATRATEAFATEDDEGNMKKPFEAPGWLCVYSGRFSVPETGYYRFVGMGDDAMLVGVGQSKMRMQTVLYAFWPGEGHGPSICLPKGKSQVKGDKDVPANLADQWEPAKYCGPGGADGKNVSAKPADAAKANSMGGQRGYLYKGHWLHLKKDVKYFVSVAFGEGAGGAAGATLGLQKKGRDTDQNFPMFTLESLEEPPAGWAVSEKGMYNTSECYIATGPAK
ncbi:MAG: hypothetical protein K6B46_00865 [Opitutales bacterium]|nr:hypothetical protein [Opitutales bacterium]